MKRDLIDRTLEAVMTLMSLAIAALLLMALVEVIHTEWTAAVPQIGWWTSVKITLLGFGAYWWWTVSLRHERRTASRG